ncbi:MAG: GHKL domain-containing protein [Spirochaetes bacterium]|nr:GHKL domain-containing protein [Spirochaetota bacterium]
MKFNEFEAKKQELNCGVNIIPVIRFLEKNFGMNKTINIVESLGLPLSFLSNKRNWVSYSYYSSLLDKLVEVTEDKRAPFKIASVLRPESIFDDIMYAGYASIFFSNPKIMYKSIISKNIYKTYQKIGDFNLLNETKNSISFEYILKNNYKHKNNNCIAIEGYLSFGALICGYPPASTSYQITSDNRCIFTVSWEKKSKLFEIVFFTLFSIVFVSEILLYKKIFLLKDIMLSTFIFFAIYFFVKNMQFKKKITHEEIFNFDRNNSILNALSKIEKDYNDLLEKEIKIMERNTYLTIMSEARKLIYYALYFTPVLFNITKLLLDNLNFVKCVYFEFSLKKRSYEYLFDLNNEKIVTEDIKAVSFINFIMSGEIIEYIQKSNNYMNIETNDLKKYIIDKPINFNLDLFNKYYANILFIDMPSTYSGFFLFFSLKKSNFSREIIKMLFEDISDQLKICYENISTRYTIENILSSIPSYVIIFNTEDYTIKFINNLFLTSFPLIEKKIDKLDVIGKKLFTVLHFNQDVIDNIQNYINEITINNIEDLKSEVYETMINNFVFEYSLFRIPRFKNQEKLLGLIMNDITEAKYFQKNIIVNEKLLALGKVASGIAHEINNPLYAVLASAEEISENESIDNETRDYAEEIINHVISVSNIIKDLSSFSKTLRKEETYEVDLNNVIEESLKLVKYSSNYLEINIIKNLGEIPLIKTTKGEMQQVFINIFNNAVQAMNGRGTLNVETKNKSNRIIIVIKDTGSGISKENLPFIFDLYFTTKNLEEGSGQGLHIVKKIITKYNGDIKVTSKIGKGSVFHITFYLDRMGVFNE